TALVETIVQKLPNTSAEVWLCPTFVYLSEMSRELSGSRISMGAQDVCAETQGAFTGEVSASMLKDVGCAGAIVGHSAGGVIFGESDQLVALTENRTPLRVAHDGASTTDVLEHRGGHFA